MKTLIGKILTFGLCKKDYNSSLLLQKRKVG